MEPEQVEIEQLEEQLSPFAQPGDSSPPSSPPESGRVPAPPPQPSSTVANLFLKPVAAVVRTLREKVSGQKRRRSPSSPTGDRRGLSPPSFSGAKRRRRHSPGSTPSSQAPSSPHERHRGGSPPSQPSPPAEGFFRALWGTVTPSFPRAVARRIFSRGNDSRGVFLPNLVPDALHMILAQLPLIDLFRVAISCKQLHRAITSEKFKRDFCKYNTTKAPLLALFVHPYSSLYPVVTLPGSPLESILLTMNLGRWRPPFIADSRNGRFLLFTCSSVEYQRFTVYNPTTRTVIDLSRAQVRSTLMYLAAGFVPLETPLHFEVIVLYGSGTRGDGQITTALYCSIKNEWHIAEHHLDVEFPQSFSGIRLPSILTGRKWNILMMGEAILSVDLEQSPCKISFIQVPQHHRKRESALLYQNLIGKISGELCFVGIKVQGLNVWFCREHNGVRSLSDPMEYVLGVESPLLLGFAEENTSVILQRRSLARQEILLINLETHEQTMLIRQGDGLELFAYEMEWPPISMLVPNTITPRLTFL